MKALITRPSGQSAPLERMLNDAGIETFLLPLLDIQPLPLDPSMRHTLLNLDHFDAVVVISPNAAHYGLSVIDTLWPQLPVQQQWFANGQGTAQILAEAGIAPCTPPSGTTTEDLLALPEFHNISGQKWLVIGGTGGRPLLVDTLKARGASAIKWAAYQRSCPVVTDAQFTPMIQAVDLLLLSSGEALENLHQIAASTKMDINVMVAKTLIVSSSRLKQVAQDLGWTNIIVADGASNQQLTDAVLNHI